MRSESIDLLSCTEPDIPQTQEVTKPSTAALNLNNHNNQVLDNDLSKTPSSKEAETQVKIWVTETFRKWYVQVIIIKVVLDKAVNYAPQFIDTLNKFIQ